MALKIAQLLPLRLPSGWVVRLNQWFYQEPLLPSGEENPHFLPIDECLLMLHRYEPQYHPHAHWSRDYYIDLQWKGDAHTGAYWLRFYEDGDSSAVLAEMRSRSALQIQSTIDHWLDLWSLQEFPPL